MGVPAEIRSVPRPKNTVVIDSGSNGIKRYAVRERDGTKYIPGRNPQPRCGKIIGYIIDGKYCPKEELKKVKEPQYLSYGFAALLYPLSQDLLEQLTAAFGPEDAESILAFASLEVMHEHVSELRGQPSFLSRLQQSYEGTYFRVYYPKARLSEDDISGLFHRLNSDPSRRTWNTIRLGSVAEGEHIIVTRAYCMVRSPQDPDDPYSFPIMDITVLYAYCPERMEPLCLQIFPGEEPSESAFRTFLLDNDIRRGILLADLGFPYTKIKELLQDRPDLRFILPLKRNDTRVSSHHMLEFEDQVLDGDSDVQCLKQKIRGGRALYAFHDVSLDSSEEDYEDEYVFYKPVESTHVLESDLDITPDAMFAILVSQQNMEDQLQYYHTRECVAATPSEMGPDLPGSTFVDFLGSILQDRILRKAFCLDLDQEEYPYDEIRSALCLVHRLADAPPPVGREDPYWLKGLSYDFALMEKLGLLPTTPAPVKRRRGRPPKNREPQG